MSLDDKRFRAALGRFASGVTVVSTVVDGVDHALTASAFTSVSLDPPLVCVNVDRRSRFGAAVERSGTWAVSILSEAGQDASTWFARRGRDLAGQFDRIEHRRGAATGAPLVQAALAWLECRTWAAYDGGDHVLLVGEVLAAEVAGLPADEPFGAERPQLDRPLLYYRSHYAGLLRSAASEHSDVTLRAAIVDDGETTDSSASPDRSEWQ